MLISQHQRCKQESFILFYFIFIHFPVAKYNRVIQFFVILTLFLSNIAPLIHHCLVAYKGG